MSTADIQGQLIVGVFDIWPFALLVYDCLLTLDWEISRYWGEAFTLTVPNVLFFANRYGTLLGNIPVIIPYFWTSQSLAEKITTCDLCHNLESYHQYFIVGTQLLVGVMLFLRTYALYERSKRALVLMLGVAVGALAVGLWAVITSTSDDTSYWVGTMPMDGISSPYYYVTVWPFPPGLCFSTGASDALVLGSLYFGVMVMSNLANILTLVIGNPYSRGIATNLYEHHLFDHDKPTHAQPPRPHARTHVRATAAEHDNYGQTTGS
ncbi:hypothetical protein B0H14DRAFT_3482454 [Mycena olivaceomarginata]|nr:hypothetical protein B0H14DRAFT_3482454 [Mycena olivaceomarginata]